MAAGNPVVGSGGQVPIAGAAQVVHADAPGQPVVVDPVLVQRPNVATYAQLSPDLLTIHTDYVRRVNDATRDDFLSYCNDSVTPTFDGFTGYMSAIRLRATPHVVPNTSPPAVNNYGGEDGDSGDADAARLQLDLNGDSESDCSRVITADDYQALLKFKTTELAKTSRWDSDLKEKINAIDVEEYIAYFDYCEQRFSVVGRTGTKKRENPMTIFEFIDFQNRGQPDVTVYDSTENLNHDPDSSSPNCCATFFSNHPRKAILLVISAIVLASLAWAWISQVVRDEKKSDGSTNAPSVSNGTLVNGTTKPHQEGYESARVANIIGWVVFGVSVAVFVCVLIVIVCDKICGDPNKPDESEEPSEEMKRVDIDHRRAKEKAKIRSTRADTARLNVENGSNEPSALPAGPNPLGAVSASTPRTKSRNRPHSRGGARGPSAAGRSPVPRPTGASATPQGQGTHPAT